MVITAEGKKALTRTVGALLPELRALITSARRSAARIVDTLQVHTNFEIGRLIVEHEQGGEERAAYGAAMLEELSSTLTEEFGRGFSRSNLEYMRRFYLEYRDRTHIGQAASGQLPSLGESQTASRKLPGIERSQTASGKLPGIEKSQTASGKLPNIGKSQTASGISPPWTLSWSHYVFLLGVKDPDARAFYEIEATNEGWSLPELRRQADSALYERLALIETRMGSGRSPARASL